MEVFILQTVTITKNSIIRYTVFLLIITAGFVCAAISRSAKAETVQVNLYFIDAQMMRLIPIKTDIPRASTEKMAQRVISELIAGHDDNPKIRRLIPNQKRCMSVKVKDKIAYVDISPDMVSSHPDGRDLELLTVYSIVNSLTSIDGVVNVRFTIDGKPQKDFKGHIDMRETFIPDYFI